MTIAPGRSPSRVGCSTGRMSTITAPAVRSPSSASGSTRSRRARAAARISSIERVLRPGPSSRMGLVHAHGSDHPGRRGECGDGIDRSGHGNQVSEHAGEECSDSETAVAPQTDRPLPIGHARSGGRHRRLPRAAPGRPSPCRRQAPSHRSPTPRNCRWRRSRRWRQPLMRREYSSAL